MSCTFCQAQDKKPPNFVILFIDDMGWRDWSGNGSDYIKTPAIDAIAKEGLVFQQGYVNAANCAPSRCAILSGQYPQRNDFYNVFTIHRGIKHVDRLSLKDIQDGQTLRSNKLTFAEALKKQGYTTAMYGKWHVSGKEKVMPDRQGFDEVDEHHAKELRKLFKKTKDPKQVYSYTNQAMAFAEQASKEGKPFLIYLAHHAVHLGYSYTDESYNLFKGKAAGINHDSPKYAAMLHDTDKSIGMFMQKLKDLNIDDNTVVILLSDNGGVPSHCKQPPLRAFKGSYYEGGIRVPFMVRWPNTIKPGKSHTPVMAIDLYPTMLDLAGVEDITSHVGKHTLDGTSIAPLLKGHKIEDRSMFWYFPAYLSGNPRYTGTRTKEYRQQPCSVIRKGDWKLHLFFEEWSLDGGQVKIDTNNSVELYNLKEDIGETNNLAAAKKDVRDALLKELLDWHKRTGAKIPKESNPLRGKLQKRKK